MQIRCPNPNCGRSYTISDDKKSLRGRCKACGHVFSVAESVDETAAPAPVAPASRSADSSIPERLGRFEVRERLGSGAFGTVYRAYDPSLDREVALKVPQAGLLTTPKAVARFFREAKAAAQLRHPHIVPLYETGADDGRHYIVSAYIKGTTLADIIEPGGISPNQAAQIVLELAEALHYAHSLKIVHRDVKPANVMLDAQGGSNLMDFGLARFELSEEKLTQDGAILGTPAYMAPEQALGRSGEANAASDQYSLGATLYELLCGETPFGGPPEIVLYNAIHHDPKAPRSVNPKVPRDLETICLKALAKQPADRYATCGNLAEDLRRWLGDEPIRARPLGLPERLGRWCRRNPFLATSTGLAAAAMVAVAVLAIAFGLEQKHAVERIGDAKRKVEQERRKTSQSLVDVYVKRGETFAMEQDPQGLLWIARALAITPSNDGARQDTCRLLISIWRKEHHDLKTLIPLIASPGDSDSTRAFSPDGKTIITLRNGTAQLWNAAAGTPIGQPMKHQGTLRAVAFSPDGRTVVTVSDDLKAQLHFWSAADGTPIGQTMKLESSASSFVEAVAVSPDGKTLITGSDNGAVRFWSAADGTPIGQPMQSQGGVKAVAFSPDGKAVITGGEVKGGYGSAQLWNAADGTPIGQPMKHEKNGVNAVAFSPDGQAVITGSSDLAQIWNAADGTPIGQPMKHEKNGVDAVAFSPDGKTAFTGSFREIRSWGLNFGLSFGQPMKHENGVNAVAFSPDGKAVITRTDNGAVRFWSSADGTPIGQPMKHQGMLRAVAFSPDGKTVVTVSGDLKAQLHLWSAVDGTPIGQTMKLESSASSFVMAVAFSPDGKTVITGSADGGVRFWNAANGTPIGSLLKHEKNGVQTVAFSPDGKAAITGSADGEVRFWNAANGTPIGQPMKHENGVSTVAFSPDGKTVVMAGYRWSPQLWNTADGTPIGQPMEHRGEVQAVAYSLDGKSVITRGGDYIAKLWNAADGTPISQTMNYQQVVTAVGFKSAAKFVISLSNVYDHEPTQFHDPANGKPVGQPMKHHGEVKTVALSPNGKFAITGCSDGTARFWSALDGSPLGPPLKHLGQVNAVAFSPDGRTVVTASSDKTARLWHAPTVISGDPRRIVLWTQVIRQMEINDQTNRIEILDSRTWQERKRDLDAQGGPLLP